MPKNIAPLPEWELVLSSAARLQSILPGFNNAALALKSFDRLYQHDHGESPLLQLHIQLANALPYDLDETELSQYKNLDSRWHDWTVVKAVCAQIATAIFDLVCDLESAKSDDKGMQ
jgi:hypothetical protein